MDSDAIGINSLPSEILCDIFLKCVRNARGRWESVTVPVTISSVCRQWRDLSLSFRDLWTRLETSITSVAPGWLIEFFDTWLRRSNGAPLDLNVVCDLTSVRSTEDHQKAERVVLMLLSHQWHWEKVDFYWVFLTSPGFHRIRLTNTPVLTAFRLCFYVRNRSVGGSFNLTRASKIEDLSLGHPVAVEFEDGPMLTSLHSLAVTLDPQQCCKLLKAAPNLKKLQATSILRPPGEERSVISHDLECLGLWGRASHTIIDILVLPVLTELRYEDFSSRNGGDRLSSFIQRSLPPLTMLDVTGNGAEEATITTVLPLLPLLQVLEMARCTISAALFRLLAVPSGAGHHAQDRSNRITCPDLIYFGFRSYSVVGDFRECIDALCAMLDSRWDGLKVCDYLDFDGASSPSSADRRKLPFLFGIGNLPVPLACSMDLDLQEFFPVQHLGPLKPAPSLKKFQLLSTKSMAYPTTRVTLSSNTLHVLDLQMGATSTFLSTNQSSQLWNDV
ncbi:uncharacterized protein FOMMEDRAFT_153820 [Fomitiporia mediterranea MF3/22]|uniref:uncharacterized protein n=1 Tax=Fomitiporia mediterranea (strain MF3/22) TaxID=694068 RepID=UPI0004408093|nr:uncharacterized protein FOMMEDRAFT_153820 [Fomitiporia mediterranea MF3/22]EJD04745.1 hypothetical protein FOMMEDRAFT_153820 [Fomitiporia mediterranea MF3/22]